MDSRLEKALEFSNFRMVLATRQTNLKLLLKNKLVLNYSGGMFKINTELLTLLKTLILSGEEEFIFIDMNDIPVFIKNLPEFYEKCIDRYKNAISRYYESYQKLNKARSIRKVIDWDEKEKE